VPASADARLQALMASKMKVASRAPNPDGSSLGYSLRRIEIPWNRARVVLLINNGLKGNK